MYKSASEKYKSFVSRSILKHNERFDYSESKYIDDNKKLTIICRKHGNFEITPKNHLRNKNGGCPQCSSEDNTNRQIGITKNSSLYYSRDTFLKKAKEKFGDRFIYDLSTFEKRTIGKIKITCKEHGTFEINPHLHLLSTHGCKECSRKIIDIAQLTTYDETIEKIKLIHKDKYTYPESNRLIYKNRRSSIEVVCPKHGIFITFAQSLLSNHGCMRCAAKYRVEHSFCPGGYSNELFLNNPVLKNKTAYLYYSEINNGEFYKIGITTKSPEVRAKDLRYKSKGNVYKVTIIKSKETTLFKAFTIEQSILMNYKTYREYKPWCTELFNKDIYEQISYFFED